MFTSLKTTPAQGAENGIYELSPVEINGYRQFVLIRGEKKDNPVLLFLHGGPGMPDMVFAHRFDKELEKYFTVVHWDRRGTGKSYSGKIKKQGLTFSQLLDDTGSMISFLKTKLGTKKLFVAAHSGGTILGLRVARAFPNDLHAYIGIGQYVNFMENQDIAYRYVMEHAQKENNGKAIKELKRLARESGDPDFTVLKNYKTLWKWTGYYGGVLFGETGMKKINKLAGGAEEYSFFDYVKLMLGASFSLNALWNEIVDVRFDEEIKTLDIPCFFIYGKQDYATAVQLGEKYYEILDAPKGKKLYIIPEASHFPQFESPSRFEHLLINQVRAFV